MWYVVVAVHMAKANKKGEVADNRGIAHHKSVLEDPLFLLAIVIACRLFIMKGAPLPESYIDMEDWCGRCHSCPLLRHPCSTLSPLLHPEQFVQL
jgi:hypothetical protein